MIKRQDGFSLVELLITMAILVMTLAAATSIFVPLFSSFKQQSTLAETNIEGIVGLEILRKDIELAGFGLPFNIPTGAGQVTTATYLEASAATSGGIPAPNTYNDGNPNLNPPRAILTGNDIAGLQGSDYLVIKATPLATNDAARKWTDVMGTVAGGKIVKQWGTPTRDPYDDLADGDRVIVLIPTRGASNQRILVNDNANFSVNFNMAAFPDAYSPGTANEVYLIYGVDTNTDLRMPFNRADYYIRRSGTVPARCAKGSAAANDTGVLMKSVIEQGTGDRGNGIPLLDCVADMQVAFGLDTDNDGDIDSWSEAFTNGAVALLNAETIRNQVKEVRVYILAHEGQYDDSYQYPNASILVGEAGIGGRNYDLTLIDKYRSYRWKVYTLAVKPKNLR